MATAHHSVALRVVRTDRARQTSVRVVLAYGARLKKNGVLAVCEELGIGFVPWGPVGMGYLTGTIDAQTKLDPKTELRSGFTRFSPEKLTANQPVVDLLRRFAPEERATPAQVALAWLLARKPFIVPIPGTRNPNHLGENLGAIQVQLSPEDLRDIDAAFSRVTVHGGRMNPMQMEIVDTTAYCISSVAARPVVD